MFHKLLAFNRFIVHEWSLLFPDLRDGFFENLTHYVGCTYEPCCTEVVSPRALNWTEWTEIQIRARFGNGCNCLKGNRVNGRGEWI